jgi:hypothetical protein
MKSNGDVESASLAEPVGNVPAAFVTENMFGLPVYITPGTGGVQPVDNDEELVDYSEREYTLFFIFRLGKTLRAVCILQFIFICILAIYSPGFIALLLFPMLGYYGARWYTYWPMYFYAVYVCCEIIGCIVSFFFLSGPGFYVVRSLYLIFCIYVVRFATRLAGYILVMEEEDREFIYANPIIVNSEKSLFW